MATKYIVKIKNKTYGMFSHWTQLICLVVLIKHDMEDKIENSRMQHPGQGPLCDRGASFTKTTRNIYCTVCTKQRYHNYYRLHKNIARLISISNTT